MSTGRVKVLRITETLPMRREAPIRKDRGFCISIL